MAAKAEAAGPPLKKIVNFAKDVLIKGKKTVIYNQTDNQAEREIKTQDKKGNSGKNRVPDENPNLKEVEKQAEFASEVTGVRKDFLMGMLVIESDLGRNTGECTYKEVEDGAENAHTNGQLSDQAWETFKGRREIVKDIADDAGYDYEKLKVSCNPPYAGTGGAMGIPQFMPDTWMEYRDRISVVVGKDNPDPWDIRDGVVAMALKVADVPGVVEHNVWSERAASKMYLSGTTSWRYDWYANEIQYWANNYKKLIG